MPVLSGWTPFGYTKDGAQIPEQAEAGAYLIRSGGGTFRQFYDERMERVDKLRAPGKQLEDEARRHEDEARRITGRVR
ncbi:hypothetical protein [Auritidibacter ignavus]|uniref:hypothetical protein n=1 Tax=Auritidibacter ignavus TaxID=678932 RepID=UPI001F1B524E|nr:MULTISPECIES: hypothetical protein [Auritidibacter]WHS36237.1 hypothetical protein QM403_09080 [Auritidibacter ignavus]